MAQKICIKCGNTNDSLEHHFKCTRFDKGTSLHVHTQNTLLDKVKQIVLRNSTEEYTHTAKSFLVGNVDKIILELNELYEK